MTTVMNMNTGDTATYSCSPSEAVVSAYESSRGNKNTLTYDSSKAVVSKSGKTVSCGEFTALCTIK